MNNETLFSYVVVVAGVTKAELVALLDEHETQVRNWYQSELPGTIFVVSPLFAQPLGKFLRRTIPGIKHLLVLDANTDRGGWLAHSAWSFLRDPRAPSDE